MIRYVRYVGMWVREGGKRRGTFFIHMNGFFFVMRVTLVIFIYFFGGWEDPEMILDL